MSPQCTQLHICRVDGALKSMGCSRFVEALIVSLPVAFSALFNIILEGI